VDDQTYKRGSKTYRRVLLKVSFRLNGQPRNKVVANISRCTENEILAIKWALKNKNKLNSIGTFGNIKIIQGLSIGSVWLLFKLAERIGLKKALGDSRFGKLSLLMVMAALIGHNSRLSVVRLASRHAFCDILGLDYFNEDDLYSAMNWLYANQESIENKLFKSHFKKLSPILYLYDVTSSYLEGDQNELGEYGYNRDKKRGKKQIVIGFMTDAEGYPISVQVFKGNTPDSTTVYDQILKIKEKFSVKKVALIGDRGMIKTAQIDDLNSENFNYITAITKPQIEKLIHDKVFQMEMFDDNLVEIEDGNIRYVLKRNPLRAQEIELNRQSKLKYCIDFAEKQNQYLSLHAKAKFDIALQKVIEKTKKLRIDKWLRVISENRMIKIRIDEKKKKQISRLDGCYALKTDLEKEFAAKDTIHSRYKDLSKIEQAFRTMKSKFIEMRGIFVRNAERTHAHVFVVMLAYSLYFHLYRYWQNIEATVEEGIDELSSICSMNVSHSDNIYCQTIPEPRQLGKLLLEGAKITLPKAIQHRNVNVVTRKKLVSERKIH